MRSTILTTKRQATNRIEILRNNRLLTCPHAAPVTLNHGMPPTRPPQWRASVYPPSGDCTGVMSYVC